MKEYTKTRYHKNFVYYKNDEIIGASLREYGEYAQTEVNFLLDIIDIIIGDIITPLTEITMEIRTVAFFTVAVDLPLESTGTVYL